MNPFEALRRKNKERLEDLEKHFDLGVVEQCRKDVEEKKRRCLQQMMHEKVDVKIDVNDWREVLGGGIPPAEEEQKK